jgi:radical SAM superfamily enzyme YgiQ (UPF0313 family)
VLLVPSLNFVSGRPEVYVPYGLLNLVATAHANAFFDVEVAMFSPAYWATQFSSSDAVVDAVVEELEPKQFDAIGFSSVCSSVHYSLSIAERLKQRRPNIQVIFGGPFVTKLAGEVLSSFSFIDAVFVGEGEPSFASYCKNLLAGRRNPLLGIPGVVTRTLASTVGIQVDNLDALPVTEDLPAYAAWARLDLSQNPGKNFVPVEATRGCPLKCSFCSTKQVWGPKVRRKSASRLSRDIMSAQTSTSANFFSLIGDNVGVPRNQFLKFCEDLIAADTSFHWACSLKLDRLQASDLDTLWAAGCRGMFIGVETATAKTLELVNKAANLEAEISNIEHAIARGFLVETSFIIGFPWETEDELKATFDLHCRFLSQGGKRSQVGILSPIPGTEIVKDGILEWGISPGTFSDDGVPLSQDHVAMITGCPGLFTHFASYKTPNLSDGVLRSFHGAAAQVNGLYQRSRVAGKEAGHPFAGRESGRAKIVSPY